MYFLASRADNFIHGRLRPVPVVPPEYFRLGREGYGQPNRAARNGPRPPHLYPILTTTT
jgi:hypothetical protein